MKIQVRDKKVLETLYKYGALTTTQLRRLCFAGIAHTTVMRRLRKLEEAKIIIRLSGLEEGLLSWTLTVDGADRVGLDRPLEYRNKNILKHTVTLAEVRFTLENVGLGTNWISEIELRRKMYNAKDPWASDRLVPDGLFAANVFSELKMVSLELEISIKTRARYQELFRQYARKNSIGLIWYIVESKTFAQSLLRIWESALRDKTIPKLMISTLDGVLSDLKSAAMTGLDGTHSAQEVFGLNPLNSPAHLAAQGVSMKTCEPLSSSKVLESQIKSAG